MSLNEAALNKLAYVKMSLPSLLEIKRQLEQNKRIIKNLNNLCQENYLKSTGITALGMVSPLASFREIEEMANQYKTQVKVQAILSDDPNAVATNSDSSFAAAGGAVAAGLTCYATACTFAGYLESVVFSVVYSAISFIPSLIARDKIKEQKMLLKQAIEIYPQKVLSTEEVLKVSKSYCFDSSDKYVDFLSDIEKYQSDYEASWYKLYEETMDQLNSTESYLIPKQIEAIMYSKIDRNLLDESDFLEFENNLLLEATVKSNQLFDLFQKVSNAKNCDSDYETIEKFSDKLNEFKNKFGDYKNSKNERLAKYFSKKIKSIENQISSIPSYYAKAANIDCER
jgi:uncharacterized protein YutD